ncbi:LamB/YcsF family protein [Undibacterium arcticum]
MTLSVNLNADMGEGFGAYDIGDDDGILKNHPFGEYRLRFPRR